MAIWLNDGVNYFALLLLASASLDALAAIKINPIVGDGVTNEIRVTPTKVRLPTDSLPSLRLEVLESDGTPVEGATVEVSAPEGSVTFQGARSAHGTTNSQGRVAFDYLPDMNENDFEIVVNARKGDVTARPKMLTQSNSIVVVKPPPPPPPPPSTSEQWVWDQDAQGATSKARFCLQSLTLILRPQPVGDEPAGQLFAICASKGVLVYGEIVDMQTNGAQRKLEIDFDTTDLARFGRDRLLSQTKKEKNLKINRSSVGFDLDSILIKRESGGSIRLEWTGKISGNLHGIGKSTSLRLDGVLMLKPDVQ